MIKNSKESKFADIYLFSYSSKSTMGIYFLAFVLVYLFLGKIGASSDVALDFWTALQMMAACMLIGFGQALIVPAERLNAARSAIWLLWASAVTIGSAVIWGWFEGFPLWCGIVFCVFTIFGFAALLLGLLFDSRRETQKLNEHLKAYQNNLR